MQKFDEAHKKNEIPPDMEYDIDNDYDIEQSEKDNAINIALQNASTILPNPAENKSKTGGQANVPKPAAQPTPNNN